MVKFGLTVFLRFGLMVKNSAFRFSYDSAFQIRPNCPVRFFLLIFICSKHIFKLSIFVILSDYQLKKANINVTWWGMGDRGRSILVQFFYMHAMQNSNTCVTSCVHSKTTEGQSFSTAILKAGRRTVASWYNRPNPEDRIMVTE